MTHSGLNEPTALTFDGSRETFPEHLLADFGREMLIGSAFDAGTGRLSVIRIGNLANRIMEPSPSRQCHQD
jgi:hypothetical protein